MAMLVWLRREEQKVAEVRLMAQATLDPKGDSAPKAFKEYLNAMFPYREHMAENSEVQQKDLLAKWTAAGPIQITPMDTGTSSEQKAAKRARMRGASLDRRVYREPEIKKPFNEGKQWIEERKAAFSTGKEPATPTVKQPWK
jgi:hypothetical protein